MASSVKNLNGSPSEFFLFDFHNLFSHILRALCDFVRTDLISYRFTSGIDVAIDFLTHTRNSFNELHLILVYPLGECHMHVPL